MTVIDMIGTIAGITSLIIAMVAMRDTGRKHTQLSETLAAICRTLLGEHDDTPATVTSTPQDIRPAIESEASDLDESPSAWLPTT